VSRLEELTDRYPQDERKGQVLFVMADSYRKSAALLNVNLNNANAAQQPAPAAAAAGPGKARDNEAAAAKRERLAKARGFYDKVIDLYRDLAPTREIDRLHLKLSHFYRADCVYDLGRFDEAIKLYDAAALKYQDDSSSLAAYVQIVNSYCALGKLEEARTANERAKWLLRKMPEGSFREGSFSMPKAYWEQWLKWTGNTGLFASNDQRN